MGCASSTADKGEASSEGSARLVVDCALILTGPAGSGKTALWGELLHNGPSPPAAERTARALIGQKLFTYDGGKALNLQLIDSPHTAASLPPYVLPSDPATPALLALVVPWFTAPETIDSAFIPARDGLPWLLLVNKIDSGGSIEGVEGRWKEWADRNGAKAALFLSATAGIGVSLIPRTALALCLQRKEPVGPHPDSRGSNN